MTGHIFWPPISCILLCCKCESPHHIRGNAHPGRSLELPPHSCKPHQVDGSGGKDLFAGVGAGCAAAGGAASGGGGAAFAAAGEMGAGGADGGAGAAVAGTGAFGGAAVAG